MKVKCDQCGREISASDMCSKNGKLLCRLCNMSQGTTNNDSIEKKYNVNNIFVTLTDFGFKEDIAKEGISIWRNFDISVSNKTNDTIEWISFGVMIQSFKKGVSTSSYISDGNTRYTEQKYRDITIYKADYTIDETIPPSCSCTWGTYKIKNGRPIEEFYGLEIYNIWGKFSNGQTFSHIVQEEKIDFNQNGCGSKTIYEKKCFVTTAAFGDSNHPMVVEFRNFRDNRLVYSDFGRRFIQWYNANGPSIARFIENRPIIKYVTRLLLQPLALGIRFFHLSDKTKR